jgi:hypothetical protein
MHNISTEIDSEGCLILKQGGMLIAKMYKRKGSDTFDVLEVSSVAGNCRGGSACFDLAIGVFRNQRSFGLKIIKSV